MITDDMPEAQCIVSAQIKVYMTLCGTILHETPFVVDMYCVLVVSDNLNNPV